MGRSPGEGNGYPLQNSCLENYVGREAWCPEEPRTHTVHGLAELNTIEQLTFLFFTFPGGSVVKNSPPNKRCRFDPWVKKMPWRGKWQLFLVFLPREVHGPRSLMGYSPWAHKDLDRTEHTHNVILYTWYSRASERALNFTIP